ncbi:alpha/beta hydrolase [Streptomyces kanamyceticus]|uniref:Alpha/beta hydrolase n=1 Tax=Streptomyces kanamyceticus TaxID=1967 RepID=A0A5J6GKY9_STRKN|nr:alpha/beta hydrolase [Streptomyces kanamyceticus]QEU95753.1 alpha/beta hydrolase [Streptomyces kanamyceticus]
MTQQPGRGAARNDVDELKQFIGVHARAQGLPDELCSRVLRRITHDGEGPGSWSGEWSVAAAELAAQGQLLAACQCWNTARFPFVDGPARAEAHARCVETFGRWSADHPGIERIEITVDGGPGAETRPDGGKGTFTALTAGLSATEPRPLLLVMGGIVSLKEQWAPALLGAEQLGMAMAVTEMPGVGENTLTYGNDGGRMLSALLDALADRADVTKTYASAMSFSGHMALRCALTDPRIRGVVTAGAPISAFFTDRAWYDATVPRITKDTLAQLTGLGEDALFDDMRSWGFTAQELAGLAIPVGYTVSLRDEIIPQEDARFLHRHGRDVALKENDDVHGSPSHVEETRAWAVQSVLAMRQRAEST